MPPQENKTIIRRLTEAFDRGDVTMVEYWVDPGYVDHSPAPGQPAGRDGLMNFARMLSTAFPDGKTTIDDLMAERDQVVCRWTARGTHKGEFMGIPATRKRVTITGMDVWRIRDGRVIEHWGEFDALGMLQQMGAVPVLEAMVR